MHGVLDRRYVRQRLLPLLLWSRMQPLLPSRTHHTRIANHTANHNMNAMISPSQTRLNPAERMQGARSLLLTIRRSCASFCCRVPPTHGRERQSSAAAQSC